MVNLLPLKDIKLTLNINDEAIVWRNNCVFTIKYFESRYLEFIIITENYL